MARLIVYKQISLICALIAGFITSCSSVQQPLHYKQVYAGNFDFESDSVTLKESENPYEGKYYGSSSEKHPFTYVYKVMLGDSFKNSSMKINLDFFARYKGANYGNTLVVSAQANDSLIGYRSFVISDYTWFRNEWYNLKDSTQFDIGNYSGDLVLKLYGYNYYGKGIADYDRIKVFIFRQE